jgi:hypothetical protein
VFFLRYLQFELNAERTVRLAISPRISFNSAMYMLLKLLLSEILRLFGPREGPRMQRVLLLNLRLKSRNFSGRERTAGRPILRIRTAKCIDPVTQ